MNLRRVILAVAVAIALVGCGGSDSDDTSSGDDATTTVADVGGDPTVDDGGDDGGATDSGDTEPTGPTAELPDDFPAELTPPDDAVYRSAQASDGGWFVQGSIPGEVAEVADAIVAQLEGAGYTVSSDEEGGIPGGAQSRTIQSESDTYIASISVDGGDVVGGVEGSANVSYTITQK